MEVAPLAHRHAELPDEGGLETTRGAEADAAMEVTACRDAPAVIIAGVLYAAGGEAETADLSPDFSDPIADTEADIWYNYRHRGEEEAKGRKHERHHPI